MTVRELIAALQGMPQDAVIHGCNRDMLEIQYRGVMLSVALILLEDGDEATVRALIRDAFKMNQATK